MFVNIKQGDCLSLMKEIPSQSVDMVLCDLPFGVTRNDWDRVIPFDLLWFEYKRITKPNSCVCLFSTQPFTTDLIQSNKDIFRYDLVWDKVKPVGFLNANRMPLRVHESILIFYKKLPVYNPQFGEGKPYTKNKDNRGTSNYGKFGPNQAKSDGRRFPKSIISVSNKTGGLHPTQKPVELLEHLIKTYTNEGDVILDNCMGSGSTGEACINLNRSFIGYEMEEQYFQIAKDRLNNKLYNKICMNH